MREFDGATIIYCRTKNFCESVCQELSDYGCSCGLYHAGLSMEMRKNVHHKFIRDELQVCVIGCGVCGNSIIPIPVCSGDCSIWYGNRQA